VSVSLSFLQTLFEVRIFAHHNHVFLVRDVFRPLPRLSVFQLCKAKPNEPDVSYTLGNRLWLLLAHSLLALPALHKENEHVLIPFCPLPCTKRLTKEAVQINCSEQV